MQRQRHYQKPLKTPDTMKNNNTDLAPIITLTCNHVGVVKYEPSSPFTVNITGFHIHAEDLKLWRRSWRIAGRGERKADLSFPADVERAPGAPSQQPGQFTSCQRDWLSMDPCSCVAANFELIKEHFSREEGSSNRPHPIHSGGNMLLL